MQYATSEKIIIMSKKLIPIESIISRIFLIRDHKVMLDFDLAQLYGVETRALKQQVRRNIKRFPDDFMFQLSKNEWNELITNCDNLGNLKFSPQTPFVFTEQGVAMLSSVLNSDKAVEVNILIIRAFVKLREIISTHKDVQKKLKNIEDKLMEHDEKIIQIINVINHLIAPPEKPKRKIGFSLE